MTTRRTPAVQGAVAFTAAVLVLWATRGVPGAVAGLAPEIWEGSPWFVADQAMRLYLLLPAAVLAGLIVWIAPGLWLVAAFSRPASTAEWVLRGFLVALGIQATGTAALALVVSGRVPDGAQLGMGIGLGVAAGVVYAWRHRGRTKEGVAPPSPTGGAVRRRSAILLGLAWLSVVGLLPTLFWMDLTGDGMEVLEIGRSLGWFPTPRGLIDVRLGPAAGMFTIGYPIRWFQALWGPIAATARLPLALYVPVLYAATLTLIELASPRALGRIEEVALAGGVAVVSLGMAFNASYNPYMADPASPAGLSLLTATLLFGAAAALFQRRTGWFLAFFVMGLLTRPTMLPFSVFVALGAALTHAEHRRRYVGYAMLAVVVAVAVSWLTELAYRWAGDEVTYGSASLIQRFRFLDLLPWDRLRFVLVPVGVVPALAFFAWARQDAVARTLTITAGLYFALVAFPAFVALHHFTPVMLLPLAVYWRCVLAADQSRSRWTVTAFAAAAIATVLVLPRDPGIPQVFRSLGERTAITTGDYGSDSWPDHVAALRIAGAIGVFLPAGPRLSDPGTELWAQLQLPFYARAEPDQADFLFHPVGPPPSSDWVTIGEADGVAVAARSLEDWRRARATVPSTDFQSRWLHIPAEMLFEFIGAPAGRYDLDLGALPVLWRVF
ncbi:MAG: hypothetical protein KJP18_02180 [Gemmatimonadetes bacterium]|nr:hypothetical protein [Gemmatimonadota bacterium]